jgi:hypothetical protein
VMIIFYTLALYRRIIKKRDDCKKHYHFKKLFIY